uniref:HAUS augmin-like complex subunit 8 n=1 Tax=Castor canadensis TaxID=51338 RepID=A0A8C0X181_CASCN
GRKGSTLQKSRVDNSSITQGNLQSTVLEGHGTAPPDLDLDLSAINDESMFRKTPQLEKTMSKKTRLTTLSAPQRKSPVSVGAPFRLNLPHVHGSQMENSLAALEDKAERKLWTMCRERERLQRQADELRRSLALCERKRELAAILDTQIELLSPFTAVSRRFQQQYKALATALDSTRHELPIQSIHLERDGQQLLDALQPELTTTCRLLRELGFDSSEANGQALDFLSELRDITVKKDLQLRRSFAQVMELSAEASKEAALMNQEVWEEAAGPDTPSQWYFNPDGAVPSVDSEPRGP